MAESIEELRGLSRDELVRRHDSAAQNTSVGTKHYLTELHRRDAEEQSARMVALTQAIHRLTLAIAALTAVSTLAVGIELAGS